MDFFSHSANSASKKKTIFYQVKLLEEEIRELEALEEVHEQLVEGNHELEMDLREELDMAQAARREVSCPNSIIANIENNQSVHF